MPMVSRDPSYCFTRSAASVDNLPVAIAISASCSLSLGTIFSPSDCFLIFNITLYCDDIVNFTKKAEIYFKNI